MEILDQNNVLLSVGGVIMEPGVDFRSLAGRETLTSQHRRRRVAILPDEPTDGEASDGGGGGGGTVLPPGSATNELLNGTTLGSWGITDEIDGGFLLMAIAPNASKHRRIPTQHATPARLGARPFHLNGLATSWRFTTAALGSRSTSRAAQSMAATSPAQSMAARSQAPLTVHC